MFVVIAILVGLFLLWWFVLRKFKIPKLMAITMFTGGVKVGKSAVSLFFAIKTYKRVHRAWYLRRFLCRLLHRVEPEEPLFYSNIPLRYIKYCELLPEHLMRTKRMNFGSVAFVDEAALMADSRVALIKDGKVNEQLLLFFKLYGHATHGGKLFINSQQISDLHVALRRCTASYFYIHHLTSVPFFKIPLLREERYAEDGTAVNSYDGDVEDSLKRVIMRSNIFKKYDSYCYSFFTDDLPTDNREQYRDKHDSLKAERIISFNPTFANLAKSTAESVSESNSDNLKGCELCENEQ